MVGRAIWWPTFVYVTVKDTLIKGEVAKIKHCIVAIEMNGKSKERETLFPMGVHQANGGPERVGDIQGYILIL